MAITTAIANPSFESGDTGWDKGSNVIITNNPGGTLALDLPEEEKRDFINR